MHENCRYFAGMFVAKGYVVKKVAKMQQEQGDRKVDLDESSAVAKSPSDFC